MSIENDECHDCQQLPCICDGDGEPQQMVCNGTCDSCDCHPSVWGTHSVPISVVLAVDPSWSTPKKTEATVPVRSQEDSANGQ